MAMVYPNQFGTRNSWEEQERQRRERSFDQNGELYEEKLARLQREGTDAARQQQEASWAAEDAAGAGGARSYSAVSGGFKPESIVQPQKMQRANEAGQLASGQIPTIRAVNTGFGVPSAASQAFSDGNVATDVANAEKAQQVNMGGAQIGQPAGGAPMRALQTLAAGGGQGDLQYADYKRRMAEQEASTATANAQTDAARRQMDPRITAAEQGYIRRSQAQADANLARGTPVDKFVQDASGRWSNVPRKGEAFLNADTASQLALQSGRTEQTLLNEKAISPEKAVPARQAKETQERAIEGTLKMWGARGGTAVNVANIRAGYEKLKADLKSGDARVAAQAKSDSAIVDAAMASGTDPSTWSPAVLAILDRAAAPVQPPGPPLGTQYGGGAGAQQTPAPPAGGAVRPGWPTDPKDGDRFLDPDTRATLIFDEARGRWRQPEATVRTR